MNNANFLICTVVAFILNLNLPLIKTPFFRKLYSTATGTFLLFYSHGSGALLNMFLILSCYFVMFLLPRKSGAILMTMWAFALMMSVHLFDHLVESTGWKVGTIIQISFAKVSILAWNYYDAGYMDNKQKSKYMSDRERYYAEVMRNKPDFFTFVNYFLFVGCSWCGP